MHNLKSSEAWLLALSHAASCQHPQGVPAADGLAVWEASAHSQADMNSTFRILTALSLSPPAEDSRGETSLFTCFRIPRCERMPKSNPKKGAYEPKT